MSLEEKIGAYIKGKGINLSVMSRETKIPYMSLYDSFFNNKKKRPIRGRELIDVCAFLGINPMDFAGNMPEGGE